jgi:hypothetical protein
VKVVLLLILKILGYVFRAADTNFQTKSISELKKQELEDLRGESTK